MSKQQIQWLNDHLIKNYNPWKVHVPNKALERSFLYQSYENFLCVIIMNKELSTVQLCKIFNWLSYVHKCLLFFFDLKFIQSI